MTLTDHKGQICLAVYVLIIQKSNNISFHAVHENLKVFIRFLNI